MSWLESIQNYLGCLWQSFMAFMEDWFVSMLRLLLEGIADVIAAIPVPAALQGGMGSVWSQLDPGLLYFLGASGVPEALAMIGVGATFRLTRKLITLGRW